MKSTDILLALALAVSAHSAIAQQKPAWSRQGESFQACMARFPALLGIQYASESERVCHNYPDDTLNCALHIKNDYGVADHRQSIKVCLLKVNPNNVARNQLYSCTIKGMGEARSAGKIVNVDAIVQECQNPSLPPTTPPRAESYQNYAPAPPPSPTYDRGTTERGYSSRTLIGKINYDKLKERLAAWLKMPETSVQNIRVDSYWNWINSLAETVSTAEIFGREFKLYIVEFNVGPKQIKCTGTDFDPNGKVDRDERMFTLHECKVHGKESDFRVQFNNLDYGYLTQIGPDFKLKMKKYEKQTGPGNINFVREKSDFLIIPY